MTYLIATEIKGFKYFIKTTCDSEGWFNFSFEGLKNNADKFPSVYQAEKILPLIKTELPLFIIPNK